MIFLNFSLKETIFRRRDKILKTQSCELTVGATHSSVGGLGLNLGKAFAFTMSPGCRARSKVISEEVGLGLG